MALTNTEMAAMNYKIVTLVIGVVMLLPVSASAALRVFACEPEWAALVSELAGNLVKIDTATQPQQDPHYVQARPSLIAKIRRADLLVCTGAGIEEGWLPVLLRKGNNRRILAGQPGHLMVSDSVQLKEKPLKLDRSEGDVHNAGNPHIQTDPRNMLPIAESITARLTKLDPDNAYTYKVNLAVFRDNWQIAIQQWEQKALPVEGKPLVVYHRSWIYLQDWLGLKEVAALEPKPGIPPGSRYLAEVIDQTRAYPELAIVHSQYQESKAIKWFAEKSGAPVVLLPSTVGGSPAAGNLYGWYEDIIARLLTAYGADDE